MPRPADGPTHSIEVERKYDVDELTPLPDFGSLPGIASIGEPEPRALDATYFDTAGLVLARAGVAVRRRSGGPDAGWHIKTQAADGRHEYGWPLEAGPEVREPQDITLPAVIEAAIAGLLKDAAAAPVVGTTAAAPVAPVARVRNDRTARALRDASGGLVAEFTDDRVRALDLLRGTESAWREWEVELGPAGPMLSADVAAFFAAVDAAVASAGGRAAASGSKLQRALGR